MQLKDVIEPFKSASHGEALALCRKHISDSSAYTVHPDGTVDIHDDVSCDSSNLTSFVVNQKLAVQFGELNGSDILTLNSVRTLEGLPKNLLHRTLEVRSDFLKDLTGCPEEINALFVRSNSLTSAKGSPRHVHGRFVLSSSALESFDGLPSFIGGTLDLAGCQNVKTTDGLESCEMWNLSLSGKLEQVTEVPKRCCSVVIPPCIGVAHLLRIPNLELVSFFNHRATSTTVSKTVDVLNNIFKECLQLYDSPKVKWLHAERLMIDHDLEYLL